MMNHSNDSAEKGTLNTDVDRINEPDQKHNSTYDDCGNDQHEALDVPLFYFLLKKFPGVLQGLTGMYQLRWKVIYLLQKRIPLHNKIFRKAKISFATYGEILFILPVAIILIFEMITSFLYPSVSLSGDMARLPLAIVIVTASRNSIVTFLFGVPFERSIFYHKLAARLAFINGVFHTFVAFSYPNLGWIRGPPSEHALQGESSNFFLFAIDGRINISGTGVLAFMVAIIITSLPIIRRRLFEVFQCLHILFAFGMVLCSFFHAGSFIVIFASIFYGGDVLIRKVLMTWILYPRKASIKQLTDTVVEISFPKTGNFNYNPGQYILIAVPQISFFEWHPFSISSSPHQDVVTLNIRVCGGWTKKLKELAGKEDSIDILIEGPYGSLGVNLISYERYKMVMLLSGGIGVTPMQSICHQLIYEHSAEKRELKRVWFLWTARDPLILENMDVSRHHFKNGFKPNHEEELKEALKRSTAARPKQVVCIKRSLLVGSIANTLLREYAPNCCSEDEWLDCISTSEIEADDEWLDCTSSVDISEGEHSPVGILESHSRPAVINDSTKHTSSSNNKKSVTDKLGEELTLDHQLFQDDEKAMQYDIEANLSEIGISMQHEESEQHEKCEVVCHTCHDPLPRSHRIQNTLNSSITSASRDSEISEVATSIANNPKIDEGDDILHLQLFLTGSKSKDEESLLPFLTMGRPDFKKTFLAMREEAIEKGETRIAVCVCAPEMIVKLCTKACVKYSDNRVRFDLHSETFD